MAANKPLIDFSALEVVDQSSSSDEDDLDEDSRKLYEEQLKLGVFDINVTGPTFGGIRPQGHPTIHQSQFRVHSKLSLQLYSLVNHKDFDFLRVEKVNTMFCSFSDDYITFKAKNVADGEVQTFQAAVWTAVDSFGKLRNVHVMSCRLKPNNNLDPFDCENEDPFLSCEIGLMEGDEFKELQKIEGFYTSTLVDRSFMFHRLHGHDSLRWIRIYCEFALFSVQARTKSTNPLEWGEWELLKIDSAVVQTEWSEHGDITAKKANFYIKLVARRVGDGLIRRFEALIRRRLNMGGGLSFQIKTAILKLEPVSLFPSFLGGECVLLAGYEASTPEFRLFSQLALQLYHIVHGDEYEFVEVLNVNIESCPDHAVSFNYLTFIGKPIQGDLVETFEALVRIKSDWLKGLSKVHAISCRLKPISSREETLEIVPLAKKQKLVAAGDGFDVGVEPEEEEVFMGYWPSTVFGSDRLNEKISVERLYQNQEYFKWKFIPLKLSSLNWIRSFCEFALYRENFKRPEFGDWELLEDTVALAQYDDGEGSFSWKASFCVRFVGRNKFNLSDRTFEAVIRRRNYRDDELYFYLSTAMLKKGS